MANFPGKTSVPLPSLVAPKAWITVLSVVTVTLITIGAISLVKQENGGVKEFAVGNPACDIQKDPCVVQFSSGGSVELTVAPRPIRGATPLQLKVKAHKLVVDSAEVDFRGEGMDMGFNRSELVRNDDGSFSGKGMLSVCLVNRMYWQATVLLNTDRGIFAAPFRFETTRN